MLWTLKFMLDIYEDIHGQPYNQEVGCWGLNQEKGGEGVFNRDGIGYVSLMASPLYRDIRS